MKDLILYIKSFFIDKHIRFIYKNNFKNRIKLFFARLFWKNPYKNTKACSIYKTEKSYKIITVYPVSSGLLTEKEPVYILPLSIKAEELKDAIFDAVSASKLISYKEYKNTAIDYLKMLKEKSLKNLYTNSKHCSVYLKNNTVDVHFSKYSEKYKCLEYDEEPNLIIEYSEENKLKIVNEIIEIMNHK
ncbi:hypothetical protein IR083_00760 [Dysgonomonas sp. GY75]|uniref:hypothetical protein n=1 Tax=Dysgonomonas sp. GY75 TaxID=2780419 RepID=UPI0018833527|nr:hypothetical protein [Dysgonomonas sp. GY75]MBF0647351.1 hypothetical protein [Dysgonomonas sp. GY75]